MPTFVFDLDGTICFNGRRISPPILSELEEIPEQCRVVIASARHPANIRDVVPRALYSRWDIIGANGAITLSSGATVHSVELDRTHAQAAIGALDKTECAYLAYGVDFVIPSDHPHELNRVVRDDLGNPLRLGLPADLDRVIKILALPEPANSHGIDLCRELPGLAVQPHSDGTFDVICPGVSKVTGLHALGEPLPVFAAFGNDANDIPLLSAARHSVGIGGHPEVANVSQKTITEGPRQSLQIAHAIRDLIRKAEECIASREQEISV